MMPVTVWVIMGIAVFMVAVSTCTRREQQQFAPQAIYNPQGTPVAQMPVPMQQQAPQPVYQSDGGSNYDGMLLGGMAGYMLGNALGGGGDSSEVHHYHNAPSQPAPRYNQHYAPSHSSGFKAPSYSRPSFSGSRSFKAPSYSRPSFGGGRRR